MEVNTEEATVRQCALRTLHIDSTKLMKSVDDLSEVELVFESGTSLSPTAVLQLAIEAILSATRMLNRQVAENRPIAYKSADIRERYRAAIGDLRNAIAEAPSGVFECRISTPWTPESPTRVSPTAAQETSATIAYLSVLTSDIGVVRAALGKPDIEGQRRVCTACDACRRCTLFVKNQPVW